MALKKEGIWQTNNFNCMQWLKSDILKNFQKGLGQLCPVCTGEQKVFRYVISKIVVYEYLERLEGKIRNC